MSAIGTSEDGSIVCGLIKVMCAYLADGDGWVMSTLVHAVNAPTRDVMRLSADAAKLVARGVRL